MKSLITLPAMASVLLLTACQASGGGTLPPVNACTPNASATFGFVATAPSDPTAIANLDTSGPATFQGAYSDRCAGVMLRGAGGLKLVERPATAPSELNICLGGFAQYESSNPRNPGSGTLNLVACDLTGQPAKDGFDLISISVLDGPFAGYSNSGFLAPGPVPGVGSGNITVH